MIWKPFVLCLFFPTVVFANTDRREYAQWNSPEYSKIVKIASEKKAYTFCTGQFVFHNLVITNAHCINDCDTTDASQCYITKSDGSIHHVKVVSHTNFDIEYNQTTGKVPESGYSSDYAFLQVIDNDFNTNDFYNIYNDYYIGPISVAGFGGLRILSDEEIKNIKAIYIKYAIIPRYREFWQQNHPKMKWDKYVKKYVPDDSFLEKRALWGVSAQDLDEILSANGVEPIFKDTENLKVSKECEIIKSDKDMVRHTCHTTSGNSGSGLINPDGVLVGLHNSAGFRRDVVSFDDYDGSGLASPTFYDALKAATGK